MTRYHYKRPADGSAGVVPVEFTEDELAWRQVQNERGQYVHDAAHRAYPGPGKWRLGECVLEVHPGCRVGAVGN